jgi:hypothetical protein
MLRRPVESALYTSPGVVIDRDNRRRGTFGRFFE